MLAALALLIFASLVLAGYAVATMLGARQEAREMLQRRVATVTGMSDGRFRVGVLKDRRLSAISALNTLLPRFGSVTPLAALIVRAGLKKRVGELMLYVLLVAFAGALLVTLATGKLLLAIMAGALAGAACRRLASCGRGGVGAFSDQLPDALDLVRAALQAGHGLMAAMSVVAEEFPDPVAEEFRDVIEEVRLGGELEGAMNKVADRMNSTDLRWTVMAIAIHRQVGGNLVEVLRNTVDTMRERAQMRRQVRALSAEGRLSAYILIALPVLMGAYMFLAKRGITFTTVTHAGRPRHADRRGCPRRGGHDMDAQRR